MTQVEVLTPLRIETRFFPDGAAGWTLRLRVYPDDVSLCRPQPPPTKDELDVLSDALAAAAAADPQVAASVAYQSAAATLGARRAWWLWRTAVVVDPAAPGVLPSVDRTGQDVRQLKVSKPIGLPDSLAVWLRFTNGTRRMAATLTPVMDQIQLDLEGEQINSATAKVPPLWWLDYSRALDVGLATEIALTGAEANAIETLVIVGGGGTAAVDLFAAHSDSGRLSVLAQGSATNTVAGAATSPSGDDPATWVKLLSETAATQPGATAFFRALGVAGTDIPQQLPVPGGDLDHLGPPQAAVTGLWPVLWGRTLRDVVGMAQSEPALARWAAKHLAAQGPLPAIRIGDQPYGVLPTSLFADWVPDPDDMPSEAELEAAILAWALPWRAGVAAAVAAATPTSGAAPVVGADAAGLLALYGHHAPSAHWRVRPVADLAQVQALQVQQGLPVSFLTDYDSSVAAAWHGSPYPIHPIAAAATRRHLPDPPHDGDEDVDALLKMIREEPESLYANSRRRLGLLGHLVRESLIIGRATIGRAWLDLGAGLNVDPDRPIPMDDAFANVVAHGGEANRLAVRAASPQGKLVADRFAEVQRALEALIKMFARDRQAVLRAVKAALDSASFRLDPWLTGVAARRLDRMAAARAAFRLGAYGWVDGPRPWQPGHPEGLAPGPTAAGLLHAPSFAQAQTAAVLRDAAQRNSGDGRWDITLGSDRIRDAVALAERVKQGVHLFEALGLEIEAIAGDPDAVRTLRKAFPTTPDDGAGAGGTSAPNDPTRRVCDGLAVLEAARAAALPAGLPVDLAERIKPLDHVLDSYADLLLVEGVYNLVTRSPEAGGAAMDAAAGLGAPPDFRAIRTPREARTVPVSCWAVLPPGGIAEDDPAPVVVADPAFAAFAPSAVLADPADPDLVRAAMLLGGAEPPRIPGGADGSNAPLQALAAAMIDNLQDRLVAVADLARAALAQLEAPIPMTPSALERLDRNWRLGLRPQAQDWIHAERLAEAHDELARRIGALDGGAPTTAAGLQAALRDLVARPHLPILPIVPRAMLPDWGSLPNGSLDASWLEIVAAVRPRLAPLEARQLTADDPWPCALEAPGDEPWAATGPVRVAFGPGLAGDSPTVAVALLDAWVDSIPSRRHVTQAAFGFNAPKTRPPQAVLLAVPPDVSAPLANEGLFDLVLEVREAALARATRPADRAGLPWATPSPVVQLQQPVDFLAGWR